MEFNGIKILLAYGAQSLNANHFLCFASKQIILIFQVSNQFPLNNFGVDLKILGYMEKVRLTLIVQLQKFVVTMMDLELTLGLLGN